MEFRILGPLEVRRDGDVVRIPGRHQPRVLAMLLLEAGQPVLLPRLVETLWGDDPPATAKRQVQNTVAALRRTLSGAGDDLIVAVGEGYQLTTTRLDAREFADLVRRGRAETAAGRPEDAFVTLSGALALWRGPALAGTGGPVLASAARRLDEEALAATEDKLAAALAIGRHAEVVTELRELVPRHRYRQRLAGQLMTALHRGGDTEAALDVYSDLRKRLAEDLGLDPAEEIQNLLGEILNGSAGGVAVARGRGRSPVPAQLPADVTELVGRGNPMLELNGLLDTGRPAPVAVISGVGGAGKTALAVHWGTKHREQFPDGQLYVNLRGFDTSEPVRPVDALRAFIRALGPGGGPLPSDLDECVSRYRALLADRRVLVVLDNARDATQVRPLLPLGASVTLVTSRNRLTELSGGDGSPIVELGSLSQSDAVDLLANLAGAVRLHGDAAATHRLAELCGRLPLALRIAGANLAHRPYDSVAGFVEELDGASDRLELLAVDGDPTAGLPAVFDRSIAVLEPAARQLLYRLGFLPTVDFAEGLAVALSPVDEDGTRELLDRLVGSHLLEQPRPGRFRFHDLMRVHVAAQQLSSLGDADRDEITRSFVAWQLEVPRGDEFDNIVRACRQWRDRPDIWRLAAGLRRLLHWTADVDAVIRLASKLLASASDRGDFDAQIEMHHLLGMAAWVGGDQPSAERHCRTAVELSLRHGDGDADGALRTNLSSVIPEDEGFGEVEQLLLETIEVAKRRGAVSDHHLRILNLAAAYRRVGRYADAERLLVHAKAFAVDSDWQLNHHFHLTMVYLFYDMGRHTDMRVWLDRVLSAGEADPPPVQVRAICLGLSGELHRLRGELAAARADLEAAIAIGDRTGRAALSNEARCSLGELYCDEGQPSRGLAIVEQVIQVLEGDRKPTLRAQARLTAGRIARRVGDLPRALRHLEAARRYYTRTALPLWFARSLLATAEVHADDGDHTVAARFARQALEIFTELGVPEAEQARSLLTSRRA